MRELYIYSVIVDFVAEFFMRSLEEFKDVPVAVRLYTPGGDPLAAWGMIDKLNQHKHPVKLMVDGKADSAGAYFLLFQDDVEALETSQFLLHRAVMRNNPNPIGADADRVNEVNKQLRAAMEKKLDIPAFEELAGVSLEVFFEGDLLIEVNLNAENAKKIGLINKIRNLADGELTALGIKFAAYSENDPQPEPKKEIDMTLQELKTKHPLLYSEVVANAQTEGITAAREEGVNAEKDRIGSWMAFVDIDAVAVKEGIESGEAISQTAMSEFNIKSVNAQTLAAIEGRNSEDTETEENSELETAIDAHVEAMKGDDKDLQATTKAAVTAASGKVDNPKAEKVDKFEEELKEVLGLKKD